MGKADHQKSGLEQGIQTLRECFGDQAYELAQVPTQAGDSATFAWLLPPDYLGIRRRLSIGFPTTFPNAGLRLSIKPSTWLLWPHSSKSTFCLYGAGQLPSFGDPVEIVRQTFSRFIDLLRLVSSDASPAIRQRHFEQEIRTYWSMQLISAQHQLILVDRPPNDGPLFALSYDLVKPGEPPRHWLARDKDALQNYLRKLYGRFFRMPTLGEPAFFVRLQSCPPVTIPTVQTFFHWLQPHLELDTHKKVLSWWNNSHKYPLRWVLAELPDTTPPTVQVFVLRQLGMHSNGHKVYGGRAAKRIRPIRALPQGHILQGASAHVLTDDVVYSRFMAPRISELGNKQVALIGVGSLGSNLAAHLLRTGIGKLLLIDPDVFKDANLGRHILGADDLGKPKASSLAKRLQEDFPLMTIRSYPMTISDVFHQHKTVLDGVDLVINTTADWRAEQDMWDLKRLFQRWSCIQGWVEPHAMIGHALYASAETIDSPESLFDQQGRFHHRFSEWPNDGLQLEPACGEGFIAGGPVAISSTAAMIADMAVQVMTDPATTQLWNTLICRPETIQSHGGTYNGPSLPSDTQQMVLSRPWPLSSTSSSIS